MRPVALLALLPLLVACEHGLDVVGRVTVPVSVQQEFTADAPGEVFVSVTLPGGTTHARRVAVLCAPGADERVVEVDTFDFACVDAGDATVTAWVVPAPLGRVVSCSATPGAGSPSAPAGEETVALAEATVAVEHLDALGRCDDGRVSLDLTVAPVDPES